MKNLRTILAEEGLLKMASLNPAAIPLRKKIKKLLASKGASKIEETDYRNNPRLRYTFGMDDDPRSLVLDFLATLHRAFPDMTLKRPRKSRYGYDGKLSKMTPQGEIKFLISSSSAYLGDKAQFGVWDKDVPVSLIVEVWAPKVKPAPKTFGVDKPLTKRQWSSILSAMRRGYDNSYAMMVDDSFDPFQRAAKKYGLGAYYDGEVFSFLHRKVKNFDGKLSNQEVVELNEARQRDA